LATLDLFTTERLLFLARRLRICTPTA
jgi:hypothetical protein